jgi:signal transduction histidine kinase
VPLLECERILARNAAEQLLTFSHRQLATLDAIDPNQLLGEVEPVLRRVAGDQIEIAIGLGSPLGWVDIEPEHLERILLSLTMSSREVMPLGGKLLVETANLLVDRPYASRRFGLRTGPHVLVSVIVTGCGVETIGQSDALGQQATLGDGRADDGYGPMILLNYDLDTLLHLGQHRM